MIGIKPIVSILVPVYNVSKYLRQCLDSLVNQTLSDIEIICVNDGSTDESGKILQEYAAVDSRIVVVNKANGGLPSARNAGLDVARGKYVGFVDGDDYVDSDMYRKMYNAAIANHADIVVCGGHLFPKEEKASQWLKDVLSPRDITYRAGGEEALYSERGAKPFLWRDLIKKQLIDEHNFRLDESIVVGEDQAFQFKVFPAAKRVTFISDKLYYYRYSRPESIMNEPQYKDYGARISKHVNMMASIIQNSPGLFSSKDSAVRFFSWCVEFIYWDIIRVNAADRVDIARSFCTLLSQNGYFNHIKSYSWNVRNHFDYMYGLMEKKEEQPLISIVLTVGACADYISDCLDSLLNQSEKNTEIILYENGADDATRKLVREYLYKDMRICLRLGEWQPVSEKYNDALLTAKGKYIAFLNAYDYVQDADWLKHSVDIFDGDNTVDLIGYKEGENGKLHVENCQVADFRQFMFRIDKIRENKIKFEDYALLTGSVFFTKYCLASKYAYFIHKFMMRGDPLKRASIYADEAKLVLRAFVWLLQTARDYELTELAGRITGLLNSENYIRLITDSTYGFYIDKSSVNNPKEDFHTEVLSLLAKANELADLHGEDKAILRTFAMFIAKRHSFLEKI